jgi:hypothetical protein
MVAKALALVILTSFVSFTAYSQTPSEVHIDPQQPTVYFTPERLVGEMLWLRLHNNSRWAISFRIQNQTNITIPFRLADGREVNTLIDGAEVSPEYDIGNPVSGWYAAYWCATSEAWLAPGTSALMSAPAEKLKPLAEFYMKFRYEWAGNRNEPELRARFSYRPETKVPGSN